MSVCDAILFTGPADWLAWAAMMILGSWKMFELVFRFGRWFENKLK